MNFGIYIENVGDYDVAVPAFEAANTAFDIKDFLASSLFFQNMGRKPTKNKFGLFNSSDICFFNGELVVTFLDGVKSAVKEINNRNIYYYYGLEKNNDLFGLISVSNDPHVKIVVKDREDYDYVKRVTGKEPIATAPLETLPTIIASLKERNEGKH